VGEAALCGFLVAFLYLARGIITRPDVAPAYVVAYGGAGAILGAIVGVMLRTIAVVVLKVSKASAVYTRI
jgi:hypothetical protein